MKTLILIPTELERRQLREPLHDALAAALADGSRLELCGFGPVAAAARTASLLAAARPERVVLVGIAGSLDPRLEIGRAYHFSEVACHGIGAGEGASFVTASELGWPQWPGDPPEAAEAVGDVVPCSAATAAAGMAAEAGQLLTVCAASACPAEAAHRRRLFPAAVAEDMEGFGVAAACRMAGVPLTIIRGISNQAGNREVSSWKIPAALAAAGTVARQLLEEI